MTSKRILIVGCGQIGLRLANLLVKTHQVWGLKLSLPNMPAGNVQFIVADVTRRETLAGNLPDNIDYLIYCLTPNRRDEQSYRDVYLQGLKNILAVLPQNRPLSRLYFISSTSVYSQNDHSWVDENSPTVPARYSGKILLEAEASAASSTHPSTAIRFSGIYGKNRTRLLTQLKKGTASLQAINKFSNRIHEDDCVGFLHHLLLEDMAGKTNLPLYLASDSLPIEQNKVLAFLAAKLSIVLEKEGDENQVHSAGSKKCSNQLMLKNGYLLQFPSYREGYTKILEDWGNK